MLGPISIASEELRSLVTAAIEKAVEKGELAAPLTDCLNFLSNSRLIPHTATLQPTPPWQAQELSESRPVPSPRR